ncbi:MAG: hypothetical protein AAF846_26870 [Chloroflexota bacterium]
MNTNFLLRALPYALTNEQNCSLTDIEMPDTITAGQDLSISIVGMTHQIPYQIALELVVDYFAKDFTSVVDGYHPIAHLHREDIESRYGQYVSSRLSEEDIESLAYNYWDDSFADSYGYTLDYLLECHHPDVLYAPEKVIEDRLANELCAFMMYLGNFEQDFILDFLKAEVARDSSEDQLTSLGTNLVRRFMAAMQVANVVPDHINCDDIVKRLNYRDYQQNFLVALRVQARAEFADYLPDIQRSENQIRALLASPYESGLSISQALATYLPKIRADWEEDRATQAQSQAHLDYDNARSKRIATHVNLCDPISDELLTVKITGNKDSIHLGFPDINADSESVEHQVTLEYRDGQVQILVKDMRSQTITQVIPLGSKPS